jgi:hypothetical protein
MAEENALGGFKPRRFAVLSVCLTHPAGETTARAVQSAEFGCRSRKFDRAATLHSNSGSGVGEA